MNKKGFNLKRHIAALVILPVLIAYLYYLPPYPYFMILLATVCVIGMREFYKMYKVPAMLQVPGIAAGAILVYITGCCPEYLPAAVFTGLFLLLILRLFIISTPDGCMSEIGPLGLGIFYVAGFLAFQWLLRSGANGMEYIFLLYFSVWFSDGMAYYIGTYLGKNKLYPSVSPNKTIEGAFGSIIGGILGAYVCRYIFSMDYISLAGIVITGAVLGITAMTGDLVESMFKRDAGVKDSGSIIPGHGGILDKLDGPLFSGPVLYVIVRFF